MSLESILQKKIQSAMDFIVNAVALSPTERWKLRVTKPQIEYIVDDTLEGHAQFEVWSNGQEEKYIFRFRSEAVTDPAAIGEEAGHAVRLIVDDNLRSILLKTPKESKEYETLVALEEYAARYAALAYLNHHKITEYNNLLSTIANGKITLYTTRPSDAMSHFYGYAQAEIDFKRLGVKGLKDVFFTKDMSVLRDAYKLEQPQIVNLAA